MKISHNQYLEYAENGYLVMRNFFDIAELNEIFSEVKSIFKIVIEKELNIKGLNVDDQEDFDLKMFALFKKNNALFINTGKHAQHTFHLWNLASSKKINDLLKALKLDLPTLSVRPSMFFNSKFLDNVGHYWKLGSHQDWKSSQGSIDSVTLWYPYLNCNKNLGALEVVPGSHKRGLLPFEDQGYYGKLKDGIVEDKDFVSVEMNKSDLLLFNSFLIHRSGENITKQIRWSSQLRYNNFSESTFLRRGVPNPYIYKPFEDLVEPGPPTAIELEEYFKERVK